ncbi:hypothetical protein GCM10012288_19530 [Malaciobacter pacificus]|jgi:hypothetical protein|uniref:Uncharacterized protein n=1 Tax=Malaciobacter pacificus TaxID=1080223 RepID=A0A5C2HA72_9BACT|nr:DUF1104 domain-containing protein [Malaciobacter pacificus]QEP34415.1 hypothetical protein APAC_1298 [Malaciobacter pacificus]GGD45284.1 hypothetical protein GCM10012288_19530 [Malaciobacter pacificus]
MRKIVVSIIFVFTSLMAKVDYSEMSTQELIAIMGYVKSENKKAFNKELNSRVPLMNTKEYEMYKKNKEKLNR